MVITDDRWTCPDCDRTFAVEDSFERARNRLAAVRATHAVEHRDGRGAPVSKPPATAGAARSRRVTMGRVG
jgi:hypothetical protein